MSHHVTLCHSVGWVRLSSLHSVHSNVLWRRTYSVMTEEKTHQRFPMWVLLIELTLNNTELTISLTEPVSPSHTKFYAPVSPPTLSLTVRNCEGLAPQVWGPARSILLLAPRAFRVWTHLNPPENIKYNGRVSNLPSSLLNACSIQFLGLSFTIRFMSKHSWRVWSAQPRGCVAV